MDYLPLHPKNVYKRPIKQVDKWLIEFYFPCRIDSIKFSRVWQEYLLIEFYFPGGWIPFTSILAKPD